MDKYALYKLAMRKYADGASSAPAPAPAPAPAAVTQTAPSNNNNNTIFGMDPHLARILMGAGLFGMLGGAFGGAKAMLPAMALGGIFGHYWPKLQQARGMLGNSGSSFGNRGINNNVSNGNATAPVSQPQLPMAQARNISPQKRWFNAFLKHTGLPEGTTPADMRTKHPNAWKEYQSRIRTTNYDVNEFQGSGGKNNQAAPPLPPYPGPPEYDSSR